MYRFLPRSPANPLRRPPWRRSVFSQAVQRRIDVVLKRHAEIMEDMKSSGHTSASLGKELASLSHTASLVHQQQALDDEERSIQELLSEAQHAEDTDLAEDCTGELVRLENERVALEEQIIDAILPQDSGDLESDAVIEVRAGTGGDEASLFASELLDCYVKTAKLFNWKPDSLSESRTEIGGIREAVFEVSGSSKSLFSDGSANSQSLGPYGAFRFESGVHRVQRVPVNDSRIHTSACSVAVLPSLTDTQSSGLLPASELRIETMRASGAGGQHVNTTDSAVRITHIPTGIAASIQDERSQHKNKEKALKLIAARVHDQLREEEERKRGDTRSSLLGGGDRSERIRTYNFPQVRTIGAYQYLFISSYD